MHRGKYFIGRDKARFQATSAALGWIELMLQAADHAPIDRLPLSLKDRQEILQDCTTWAKLLYGWDRPAFRKFVSLARQPCPQCRANQSEIRFRYFSLRRVRMRCGRGQNSSDT